jgi:DNA-binding Lrp family transcriptional regulator
MSERIRFSEAAERLEVSENTLRKRIREWGITVYMNPRDKRERLLDWNELQQCFQEHPIEDREGKAAA